MVAEQDRAALLFGAEPIPAHRARIRGVRKAHQECNQRATERLRPERFGIHPQLLEPRIVLALDLKPRVRATAFAGNAKFVMRNGGQVRVERARKMRAIVEQTAQRLGRDAHVVATRAVHAAVHVALEMTGFTS